MRITSAYFGALALGSSLLFSTAAFAAPSGCNDNNGGTSGSYAPYNPALLNVTFMNGWPLGGTVQVPANTTPGTVLLTMEHNSFPNLDSLSQYEAAKYIAYANCTAGRVENFRVQGLGTNFSGVYRMNSTDNIGYRVNYPGWPAIPQNTLSFTAGVGNPGTTAYPGPGAGVNRFMLYPPVGTMRVEYVLLDTTWPATRQVTISGTLARVDVDGVGAGQLLRYNPFAIKFIPEPCYFTSNKVINVTLNPVDSDQFTGTGTKIGTAQVPLLQMRCSDTNITPKVKITGTSDDSNTPGVLKNLAPTDPASGVGIMLEHNPAGTTPFPVDLYGGTATSALGLVEIGSCGSNCKDWSLPLQASYYSTSDTVVSGLVQGQATVEVQYP